MLENRVGIKLSFSNQFSLQEMRIEKRIEELCMQCLAHFLFFWKSCQALNRRLIRDVDGNLAECWKAVNKQHRRDI